MHGSPTVVDIVQAWLPFVDYWALRFVMDVRKSKPLSGIRGGAAPADETELNWVRCVGH